LGCEAASPSPLQHVRYHQTRAAAAQAQLARDVAEGGALLGVHHAVQAHDAQHRARRVRVQLGRQLLEHALHHLARAASSLGVIGLGLEGD